MLLVLLALVRGVAGANKSANFTFYSFISIKKSDPENQSGIAFKNFSFASTVRHRHRPTSVVISRLAGAKGRRMKKRTHVKELHREHGPRFWTVCGMFEWSFQGVLATPQKIAKDSFEACIARISRCAIIDTIGFCHNILSNLPSCQLLLAHKAATPSLTGWKCKHDEIWQYAGIWQSPH